MAERLSNVIRAPFQGQVDLRGWLPRNPEEERWQMEGLEPSVQLFEGSTDEKKAPNLSDYLALKEDEYNLGISRRPGLTGAEILDILRQANPGVTRR